MAKLLAERLEQKGKQSLLSKGEYLQCVEGEDDLKEEDDNGLKRENLKKEDNQTFTFANTFELPKGLHNNPSKGDDKYMRTMEERTTLTEALPGPQFPPPSKHQVGSISLAGLPKSSESSKPLNNDNHNNHNIHSEDSDYDDGEYGFNKDSNGDSNSKSSSLAIVLILVIILLVCIYLFWKKNYIETKIFLVSICVVVTLGFFSLISINSSGQ